MLGNMLGGGAGAGEEKEEEPVKRVEPVKGPPKMKKIHMRKKR
jgi:hypothetical protein